MKKIFIIINFLIIFNFSFSASCEMFENNCLKCDPLTNLCFRCEYDVLTPDDKGGCTGAKKCIYGKYFDDENYTYCHCRRGLLTMDNDGKNKNNFKFLITLKHIPWFDGKHVVRLYFNR